MYIIIGGDQKQYGPISAADVRQWLVEGRLNEQTLMKAESDAEFRPLGTFPEFAAAFAHQPAAASVASPADWAERDYELDIGGCLTRGWDVVKNNFGLLFVATLVLILIAFASLSVLNLMFTLIIPNHLMEIAAFKVGFGLFLSVAFAFIMGPLIGGYYLIYVKLIRKQPGNVGDLFEGFRKSYSDLSLGYLMVSLLTGLCTAPFNYLLSAKLAPLMASMHNATPAELQNLSPQIMAAVTSCLPILLICMIPVIYITVNWMFTQALIIDKQLSFSRAMGISWKMVHKHWWYVFGLIVITGLLNVAGFFACCIGLLLTVPVGFAALMIAYETIFSEGTSA